MRFYIYCESDEAMVEPYILAEVVRDDANDRSLSLAASLAGPRSKIATRVELRATIEGRRALECWDARDDEMFDTETALLARVGRSGPVRLHLVGEEPERKRIERRLPADENLRRVVLISRGLRELSRQTIQRARALREEVNERTAERKEKNELTG